MGDVFGGMLAETGCTSPVVSLSTVGQGITRSGRLT